MFIYGDVCMYVCMYVYLYVCMYVCMYACIHVCLYGGALTDRSKSKSCPIRLEFPTGVKGWLLCYLEGISQPLAIGDFEKSERVREQHVRQLLLDDCVK